MALENAINSGAVCGLSFSIGIMVLVEFLICRGVRPKSNRAAISTGSSSRTRLRGKRSPAITKFVEMLLAPGDQLPCCTLAVRKIGKVGLAALSTGRTFPLCSAARRTVQPGPRMTAPKQGSGESAIVKRISFIAVFPCSFLTESVFDFDRFRPRDLTRDCFHGVKFGNCLPGGIRSDGGTGRGANGNDHREAGRGGPKTRLRAVVRRSVRDEV